MTQLSKTAYETKYNTAGAGSFPDNNIQAIIEGTMRSFAKDSSDSFVYIGSDSPLDFRTITITAHGFSVKDCLKLNGSGVPVKITTPGTDLFIGMVVNVIDANNFQLALNGYTSSISGVVAGTLYYIQATGTIGTGVTTAPILFADSTTSGYILSSGSSGGTALTLTTTGSSGAATLVGTTLNIPIYSGAGAQAINNITAATSANTAINNAAFLQEWQWNGLVDGTGFLYSTTATGSTASTQKLVQMTATGANTNSAQKTVTLSLSNARTGTSPQNVALDIPVGQQRIGAVGINSLSGVGAVNVGYLEISDTNTPGITIGRTTSSYYSMFMSSTSWIFRGGSAGNNLWIIDGPTTGNQSWAQVIQSASNTAFTFTQAAHTGGTPTGYLFTGGAHTTIAAAQAYDVRFNLNRTVQFVGSTTAGANNITTQNAFAIFNPTYSYSSTGAQVILFAATAYIAGSPITSTNTSFGEAAGLKIDGVTLTNVTTSYGLYVSANTGASSNYSAAFIGGAGVKLPHLVGNTASPPSIAAGTGAGTSPTGVGCVGTDLSGVVTLTTGTSPTAAGDVFTITFNTAYLTTARVTFSPNNNAAGTFAICDVYGTATTTTWKLTCVTGFSLTASTTYSWTYSVSQ